MTTTGTIMMESTSKIAPTKEHTKEYADLDSPTDARDVDAPSNASLKNENNLESETEDEEVKMNCVGGVRGMDTSDMYTSDDDDPFDDDEDEIATADRNQGVVNFVNDHVKNALPLVRPKATSPGRISSLSPLEEGEDEGSETSSVSSIGARGVALSLGTRSALSDQSDDDESSRDEELNDANLEEEEEESGAGSDGDDDDELSSIMGSIGDRPEESELDDSERHIGVAEDRVDLITVPKTKRVLSFNTLAALNADAGHSDDSPKRLKSLKELDFDLQYPFSLGAPAITNDTELSRSLQEFRERESPMMSSSDEEALDQRLEVELDQKEHNSRDNTPVPLLTPPESPLTVEIDGNKTTVCEWPSALESDRGMEMAVAISEIRPLSPNELEDFEREEDDRVATHAAEAKKGAEASMLTPLLKGIYVGR